MQTHPSRFVLGNANLATLVAGGVPYGLIERGALAVVDGSIAWLGRSADLPEDYRPLVYIDLEGAMITPALIDCHTHLVYGGNRAREFELRLHGASYADIARAGGGILATVAATRAASEDGLLEAALRRVDQMIAQGVATLEIKSGYGLDLDTELKMLRVARRIAQQRPLRVRTTFLGAHSLPPEFMGRADDYIDFVCEQVLPEAHAQGLADAVDAFCENIAFSTAQVERVFRKAAELGLPVKLHAEQLSDQGGAALAASFQALSADHLEYLDHAGVAALAESGTVAVLLPGAFYSLRETQLPPLAALREAGVPLALASDCNPGSAPLNSLLLALNMGCTLFRLTPQEALAGATREAARALGLDDQLGTLAVGKRADLAVWSIDEPAELAYHIGFNPLRRRYFAGQPG